MVVAIFLGDPFGFDYEMEDGSGNEWLDSTQRIINYKFR